MTFSEAEQFLLSMVNLPRKEYMRDPKHCKVYLDRLQFFLDVLGNPEKQIPHYIHVAGTSGKGSLCAFLHGILAAAGKKTGKLESPHPSSIVERWQVGNKHMTKREFVEIVEQIKPALDTYIQTSPYDMPSYSEVKTAIGLLYFAQKNVEWAVIETACGGRYDSTNILPYKDVAVVTNIGLDHTGILGDTKEQIAIEKAGIIKKGSAVFTAERDKKILPIIEKECAEKKTECRVVHVGGEIQTQTLAGTTFTYSGHEYEVRTIGAHQVSNAVLAINIAQHLGISQSAIKRGLKKKKQPLRMEVVHNNPTIILDAAHNEDKITTSVDTLLQLSKIPDSKFQILNSHLVIGFCQDKILPAILKQLLKLKPKTIACTRNTTNPFRRVHAPQDIAAMLKKRKTGAKIATFLDPTDALAWSKKQAKKNGLILVTGSVFLAGELRGK